MSQIKAPQLGDLGEATLRIGENAPQRILPCRKIPLAVEEPVREELDREKGVLVPVTEPWITETAVVHKPIVHNAHAYALTCNR